MTPGKNAVLIIEDDKALLTALHDILETLGVDVIGADNGREGVALYRHHNQKIQLVVLDLRIPDMEGTEILHVLRKINPRVKTLVSSAYEEQDFRKSIGNLYDIPFIRKPFNLHTFLTTVEGLLEY